MYRFIVEIVLHFDLHNAMLLAHRKLTLLPYRVISPRSVQIDLDHSNTNV